VVEAAGEDERIRVTGAEAKRVKREALGIPDRAENRQRVTVPMQRRTPEAVGAAAHPVVPAAPRRCATGEADREP